MFWRDKAFSMMFFITACIYTKSKNRDEAYHDWEIYIREANGLTTMKKLVITLL